MTMEPTIHTDRLIALHHCSGLAGGVAGCKSQVLQMGQRRFQTTLRRPGQGWGSIAMGSGAIMRQPATERGTYRNPARP